MSQDNARFYRLEGNPSVDPHVDNDFEIFRVSAQDINYKRNVDSVCG